jgi:hypothetical protein
MSGSISPSSSNQIDEKSDQFSEADHDSSNVSDTHNVILDRNPHLINVNIDQNYSQLTLLEKRDKNIERNKNYFLALFGSSEPGLSATPNNGQSDSKTNGSNIKIDEDNLNKLINDEEEKRKNTVESMSTYFPHRREVIQKLIGYLNPVSEFLSVNQLLTSI